MSNYFRPPSSPDFGNQSNYFEISDYLEFNDPWLEDGDTAAQAEYAQNPVYPAYEVNEGGGSSSHHEEPNTGYGRERNEAREKVAFKVKSSTDILDDGYKWRKYGKKMVKNSPNPRNYYRCSADGCPVKKRVERDREDPVYVVATYEGKHNHETPRLNHRARSIDRDPIAKSKTLSYVTAVYVYDTNDACVSGAQYVAGRRDKAAHSFAVVQSPPLRLQTLLRPPTLREMPIALSTDTPKTQHYELPTSFFKLVLGKHMKYSCCYFPEKSSTLEDAEEAMLELYCERSQIKDGHTVLDVGCGWGSLCLYIAQKYNNCRITGICNSTTQKAYIEDQCRDRQLQNVDIIVADISTYEMEASYDRIFSIEMFEHMKNYKDLLKKISRWMKEDSRLFVQHFCHKAFAYHFEDINEDDWITRYFFTGGTMPAANLLLYFQCTVYPDAILLSSMQCFHTVISQENASFHCPKPIIIKQGKTVGMSIPALIEGMLIPGFVCFSHMIGMDNGAKSDDVSVINHWLVNGKHYQRTSEAWLKRMDQSLASIKPVMELTYGKDSAVKWTVYWRTFFIAVTELFGYNNGEEWMVALFLFKKK
uniref:WRKY transcription factor 54 n=1 Tax=Santalum album TaxID=35974 RepID=A0A650C357_SANAL|nr:WRKY transcription factor 54 [Santalum album]